MVQVVVPVKMNFIRHAVCGLMAFQEILFHIGHSCSRSECYEQVLMALNAVGDAMSRDLARPARYAGHSNAALPGRPFFPAKWGVTSVRPRKQFIAVVGGVD